MPIIRVTSAREPHAYITIHRLLWVMRRAGAMSKVVTENYGDETRQFSTPRCHQSSYPHTGKCRLLSPSPTKSVQRCPQASRPRRHHSHRAKAARGVSPRAEIFPATEKRPYCNSAPPPQNGDELISSDARETPAQRPRRRASRVSN